MLAPADAAESFWLKRIADGYFSCDPGAGAGEALETFWRDVFSTARAGSRILEIGCGSGQVSAWAAEAGRQFDIIASDIHDHPEVVQLRPGMTFLGASRAEALPLPSASIDMVVSNFAFEYTPSRQQAADELVRVLRPGGAAALVLHSHDSALSAHSRHLLQTNRMLAQADIPGRIRRAAALRSDHLSRRKLLKEVLKMRGQIADSAPYFEIADRLAHNDPKARQDYEALEKTAESITELAEVQMRAALDERALVALQQHFAGLGMRVSSTDITGRYATAISQKFGWLMFLNKPRLG
jgi:ubiquinone/menaquinone biosynthesis C-methylase UbiE